VLELRVIVKVDSQGRISIPVKVRRLAKIRENELAILTYKDGKITIEPLGTTWLGVPI